MEVEPAWILEEENILSLSNTVKRKILISDATKVTLLV